MSEYKHSQFNAGWWSCFVSISTVDLHLTNGMSAMLRHILIDAGVTKEEAEYVLKLNIVDNEKTREVVKEYIGYLDKRL